MSLLKWSAVPSGKILTIYGKFVEGFFQTYRITEIFSIPFSLSERRHRMRRKKWAHVMLLVIGLALLGVFPTGCTISSTASSGPNYNNSGPSDVSATATDGATLQCRVTGENGLPVRSASVTISASSSDKSAQKDITVKTDSNGEFTSTVALGYQLKIYIIGGSCGGGDSQSSITYYATFVDNGKIQLIFSKPSTAGSSTGTLIPSVTLTGTAKGVKSNSIVLSWTQSSASNFSCYRIYRSTSPNVTTNSNLLTTISDVNTLTFTDYPSNSGVYFYKVFAMAGSGTLLSGTGSNEVSATTDTSVTTNTCYLTMYSTGYVGASVLPTAGALAAGTYSLTQPSGTSTDMTYTLGSAWTINNTYYGNPVAGSYPSTIDTTVDPQRMYATVQTSATGTYVIKNPTQDCTYNLTAAAPQTISVKATANSDGTISVSWTDLGSNYRYLVTAWDYVLSSSTKVKARWCNVDPVTVNDLKPSEFFAYGINQLYSTNSCTIPCVFNTGDSISIWVTAYDTKNSSFSLNNNMIGQAQIYASVTSEPATATIVGGLPNQSVYALFVGVNKYQNFPPWPTLGQCVNDANGMKAAFEGSAMWADAQVEVLTDSQATRANILAKIQEMSQSAPSGSLFLFYFSGHGGNDVTDGIGTDSQSYIAPVDGTAEASTLISGNDLYSILQNTACNKCIIFDSCRSGGFIGKNKNISSKEANDYFVKGFSRQLEKLTNIVFMAACKGSQSSVETSALGHGVFTYYLLEGIGPSGTAAGNADVNKDGVVTAEEAFTYAKPLALKYNPDQEAQEQDNYGGDLEIKK